MMQVLWRVFNDTFRRQTGKSAAFNNSSAGALSAYRSHTKDSSSLFF